MMWHILLHCLLACCAFSAMMAVHMDITHTSHALPFYGHCTNQLASASAQVATDVGEIVIDYKAMNSQKTKPKFCSSALTF